MTVVEALANVMADVTSIKKKDENSFHKFLFRGIDTVINEVGPALRTHGVVVLPELRQLDTRDVQTEKGKMSREVTVTVAYTFHGPDGDTLTCVVPGEAQDTGDKAVSKAMSVAFRTALIQALAIPTQEREPDSQSYTRKPDLLTSWKNKLWEEAKKRDWGVDDLAGAFDVWSEGEDIRDADAARLETFYKHLCPPKTRAVSRKPAVVTPEPTFDEPAETKPVEDEPTPEPPLDEGWPPVAEVPGE